MGEQDAMQAAQAQPQQLPPECQMTQDDLIIMIGEAEYHKRQKDKIIAYQGTVNQQLGMQLGQAQAAMQNASDNTAELENLRQTADSLRGSVTETTQHFERRLEETAQQRDAAIKEHRNAVDALDAVTRERDEAQAKIIALEQTIASYPAKKRKRD